MTKHADYDKWMKFCQRHSAFIANFLSIHAPLSFELMEKHARKLSWGYSVSCDISIYASHDFLEPGVIYNQAINWESKVRWLVLSNLAMKGGDLSLRFRDFWDEEERINQQDPYNRPGEQVLRELVQFVMACPLSVNDVILEDARAVHDHSKIQFEEEVGCVLTVSDLETGVRGVVSKEECIIESTKNILGRFDNRTKNRLACDELHEILESSKKCRVNYLWDKNIWDRTLRDIFSLEFIDEFFSELPSEYYGEVGPSYPFKDG